MSSLVVYSSNGCAGCAAVAQHLTRAGIQYEVLKIDESAEAMLTFRAVGFRTVPQVCLPDGTVIASSLMELLKLPAGVLEPFKNT